MKPRELPLLAHRKRWLSSIASMFAGRAEATSFSILPPLRNLCPFRHGGVSSSFMSAGFVAFIEAVRTQQ